MTERPTPEGTIGPFYPGVFVTQMPQDLGTPSPLVAHRPHGQPIVCHMRFIDALRRPVPGLLVESWQANAHGRYRHPLDRSARPLDPQFDGFARLLTSDEGALSLCTIKPGPHPVREDSEIVRAPHLRLTIFASGIDRLATQIFFDDEPLNRSDPVLNCISEPQVRERLIARRRDVPDSEQVAGRVGYAIQIVLRGEAETPFFDDWP
jgi:protocatechuate 3,4-dioxygenase beta subunit